MTDIPKICLNMIVKNESKIIERLLTSVVGFIDEIFIVDTGSSDNTIEKITEFMKNNNIKGQVLQHHFVNFGLTRSFALERCQESSSCDYILLLDADMTLKFGEDTNKNDLKRTLSEDVYYLTQGDDAFYYKNVRLVKNYKRFYYLGVTHEYLNCNEMYSKDTISKDVLCIHDIGDGGSKGDKFKRDIDLLEKGLLSEPNNVRYMFYLANSYKDDGQYEKAIKNYDKRIQSGGWEQEIWCSYYYKGLCFQSMKKMGDAIESWLLGFQFMPKRLETIYSIIKHFREENKPLLAYHFYRMAQEHRHDIENREDELFFNSDVYDYKIDYEISIVAYYVNIERNKVNLLCMSLLNKNLPHTLEKNVLSNYKYYAGNLSKNACECELDFSLFKETGKDIEMKHQFEFHNSSPSIVFYQDKIIQVVRYINYYLDSNGFYKSKDENGDYQKLKSIETRNVFTVFNYKDKKLVKEKEFEIKYDRIFDDYYKGIEDMRLMEHNNELFFTGSKITNSQDLTIYIEHGKINLDDECVESCLLDIENRSKTEKNWVMFSNNSKKYIVYNWFPITVCKFEDKQFDKKLKIKEVDIIKKINSPRLFKYVRGSTNGVNIENEIWFINHIVSHENQRYYYHMFVVLDAETLQLKKYSNLFTMQNNRIEYTLGFLFIKEENKFIIGYSKNDSNTDYICIKRSELDDMMIKLL